MGAGGTHEPLRVWGRVWCHEGWVKGIGVKNEFGQGISLLVGVLSSAEMDGGKWDYAGSLPGLPLPGVTHNTGHRGDSGDDLKVH